MFVWNPQVLYIHEPKFQIQNSVYTDQFAPHGATKSESTLFYFANLGKCASSFSTYVRAYFKTLGPTEGKEQNFHLVFPFFEQLLSIFSNRNDPNQPAPFRVSLAWVDSFWKNLMLGQWPLSVMP